MYIIPFLSWATVILEPHKVMEENSSHTSAYVGYVKSTAIKQMHIYIFVIAH